MKKARFYYSEPWYKAEVVFVPATGDAAFTNKKPSPLPRITICGVLDTETNVLSFGAAVCSSKDRFEKKVGRELAEKRALKCPLQQVAVTKDSISEIFITTAHAIEDRINKMHHLKLEGIKQSKD